jgi:chromosome segregation ATPase
MSQIYTLKDIDSSSGEKLGEKPFNRYPSNREEPEERLSCAIKDREKLIESAKRLIVKHDVLSEENKRIHGELEQSQARELERERQSSHVKSQIKELCEANKWLRSFAENSKNEINSLRTRINELETELREVDSSFAYINDTLSGEAKKSKQFLLEFQSFFDPNKVIDGQEVRHKTSGGQVDQKITIPP